MIQLTALLPTIPTTPGPLGDPAPGDSAVATFGPLLALLAGMATTTRNDERAGDAPSTEREQQEAPIAPPTIEVSAVQLVPPTVAPSPIPEPIGIMPIAAAREVPIAPAAASDTGMILPAGGARLPAPAELMDVPPDRPIRAAAAIASAPSPAPVATSAPAALRAVIEKLTRAPVPPPSAPARVETPDPAVAARLAALRVEPAAVAPQAGSAGEKSSDTHPENGRDHAPKPPVILPPRQPEAPRSVIPVATAAAPPPDPSSPPPSVQPAAATDRPVAIAEPHPVERPSARLALNHTVFGAIELRLARTASHGIELSLASPAPELRSALADAVAQRERIDSTPAIPALARPTDLTSTNTYDRGRQNEPRSGEERPAHRERDARQEAHQRQQADHNRPRRGGSFAQMTAGD